MELQAICLTEDGKYPLRLIRDNLNLLRRQEYLLFFEIAAEFIVEPLHLFQKAPALPEILLSAARTEEIEKIRRDIRWNKPEQRGLPAPAKGEELPFQPFAANHIFKYCKFFQVFFLLCAALEMRQCFLWV